MVTMQASHNFNRQVCHVIQQDYVSYMHGMAVHVHYVIQQDHKHGSQSTMWSNRTTDMASVP